VTFSAFREIPWNLFGTMAAARSQITFRTPFLDNEIVGLAYRAPAALRLSPLPALRLIHANDRFLSGIATDRGELYGSRGLGCVARRIYGEVSFKLDYLHADGMPHALSKFDPLFRLANSVVPFLGLHKFLRYRSWFRNELSSTVSSVLSSSGTKRLPFFDRAFLPRIASDHINGRKNYVREIAAVLTLEAVDRLLLNARTSE
jgi:asparagine synthase (glutamine-hydrolysing)